MIRFIMEEVNECFGSFGFVLAGGGVDVAIDALTDFLPLVVGSDDSNLVRPQVRFLHGMNREISCFGREIS